MVEEVWEKETSPKVEGDLTRMESGKKRDGGGGNAGEEGLVSGDFIAGGCRETEVGGDGTAIGRGGDGERVGEGGAMPKGGEGDACGGGGSDKFTDGGGQ
nr:uncharacterized protein LOC113735840 [Coffea arabica]